MKKISLYFSLSVGALVVLLLLLFRKKIGAKHRIKKTKVPVDKELLIKTSPKYDAVARSLYEAMAGAGTNEERIKGIFASLGDEEKKEVFNRFTDLLVAKGEYGCGNLINWLEDEGLNEQARKLRDLGLHSAEKTSWFC